VTSFIFGNIIDVADTHLEVEIRILLQECVLSRLEVHLDDVIAISNGPLFWLVVTTTPFILVSSLVIMIILIIIRNFSTH